MSAPTVADLLHIVSKPDAQRVFDRVSLPESNDEPLSAAAAVNQKKKKKKRKIKIF